jgi:hypothetical protein
MDETLGDIEKTLGKGFDVVEEVVVEDLTNVKKIKTLVPPTKNVKLRIKSASVDSFNEGKYRNIKLELVIVDGIQVGDKLLFKGKPMFQSVTFYADPNTYTKEYFQTKQHLVQLKMLGNALGEDLKGIRINDAFLSSLTGKEVLATIKQAKKKDWTNKNGELVVGEMENQVVDFKKSELI